MVTDSSRLALDGGRPVRRDLLPLTVPFVGADEARAAGDAIQSTWISANGPRTQELEHALADYTGARHAVTVSNCTAAMDLALMAAGIHDGDVIVPTYTFASTGLAAIIRGCTPRLSEVEADTANLDAESVNRLVDERTRAIMPVHYAGHPCDMDALYDIARQHEIPVIEDAAQALGSRYRETPVGGLSGSLCACFSFHAIKNVTCGEGGALLTNDDELADRARIMRDKGTDKGRYHRDQRTGYYDYVSTGHNFMLSEILAAVALVQMKKIDRITTLRAGHAAFLDTALAGYDKLALPLVKDYAGTNRHIYAVATPPGRAAYFCEAMHAEGIQANTHWPPLHLTSLYQRYGYRAGDFPVAERIFESWVRLPLWPGLSDTDLADIVRAVDKVHPHL